jgi:hypothetical protein
MRYKALWAAGVFCLVLAAPAHAQTNLQWKLKEGDKFYVESVSTTKYSVDIMGKNLKWDETTMMVISYTVKAKNNDGLVITQKYERVRVKSQGGLGAGTGLDKLPERMEGATFTFTLSPDNKISNFQGYDAFLKNLIQGMEDVARFAKAFFTEDVLKQTIEDTFGALPNKTVNTGDTWKQESKMSIGPFGTFKSAKNFSYKGKEKGEDVIAYTADLTYTPPKGDVAGLEALFKIVRGEFKSENARGSLTYDPAKGRLTGAQESMVFRGRLTLEVAMNQIELEMNMDITNRTRLLSKSPDE